MPIVFAPFVGLSLGAAFAWIAAPEIAREDGPLASSPVFRVVAAFAAFLWLPMAGYFVTFHGDWSYLYLIRSDRVPSAVDLVVVLLSGVTPAAALWISARPVRAHRFGVIAALAAAPAGLVCVGAALAARRLATSGSFEQFHHGFGTESVLASSLGKGLLFMAIVFALGLTWTIRCLLAMLPKDIG